MTKSIEQGTGKLPMPTTAQLVARAERYAKAEAMGIDTGIFHLTDNGVEHAIIELEQAFQTLDGSGRAKQHLARVIGCVKVLAATQGFDFEADILAIVNDQILNIE